MTWRAILNDIMPSDQRVFLFINCLCFWPWSGYLKHSRSYLMVVVGISESGLPASSTASSPPSAPLCSSSSSMTYAIRPGKNSSFRSGRSVWNNKNYQTLTKHNFRIWNALLFTLNAVLMTFLAKAVRHSTWFSRLSDSFSSSFFFLKIIHYNLK